MGWLIFALLYFICPLDFDFLFPVGYIDDLIVMFLCYQMSKGDQPAVREPKPASTVQKPMLIDARRQD